MYCFRFVYKLIFVDLNSKRFYFLFFFFFNKGNVEVTKFLKVLCLMLVYFRFRLRFFYRLIFVDLNLESVYI